jgi:hypothetical protein
MSRKKLPPAHDPVAIDDAIDGCLCGQAGHGVEFTTDENLPAAHGGVQPHPVELPQNADFLDGCDLDFRSGEITADADLPAASGGVA